jgi:hypothetical protein
VIQMNARTNQSAFLPTIPQSAFDAAVILTIEDEPVFVNGAAGARTCLVERFPDPDGPSFKRALAACDTYLLGGTSGAVARIMFVVAAMEAGFPFEVIEDAAHALERRTELEAEAGLRSILLRELLPE